MFKAMVEVMLGLAVIGFNPDLLSKAGIPANRWTVVELGGGGLAFRHGDVSVLLHDGLMVVTDGEETLHLSVEQITDGVRLTALNGLHAGVAVDVTADEAGTVSMETDSGFSAQAETWTETDGELRVQQGDTEELGFLGVLFLGGALAAGMALVLCLGLSGWCWNLINGTMPRRVVYSPFVCPGGQQCDM